MTTAFCLIGDDNEVALRVHNAGFDTVHLVVNGELLELSGDEARELGGALLTMVEEK